MARARNIKPGFFKNELLAELSPWDRLLFAGLWCLADREGRMEDRPKRIKMELFPCDDYKVEEGLCNLEQSGFLTRYTVNGVAVISITNFIKHQSPHGTEKDSELPDENGELTVHERSKNGCVTGNKRKCNGEITLNNVKPSLDNALIPDSLIPDSPNQNLCAANAAPPPAEPEPEKAKRGKRLPENWSLPDDWFDWAMSERPELGEAGIRLEAEKFADHWHAATKNAAKLDWLATWRNWVRNARADRNVSQFPAKSRFNNLPKINAAELNARADENKRLGVVRANF